KKGQKGRKGRLFGNGSDVRYIFFFEMDPFRLTCSVISFLTNSLLALLIISLRIPYFSSFKWYLLALPINNILYTFALLFMDVHHGIHEEAVFTVSFGILPGLAGVGVYQSIISNYYSVFFLLFLFRFSLVYKGAYASSSLHGFLSSSTAILPTVTFVLVVDLFYFCLPTVFYRPDSFTVDYIAPRMKTLFNKGRDYGYDVQIIWINRSNGFPYHNFLGAVGTVSIVLISLMSFAFIGRIIRRFIRNGPKSKSKLLRNKEVVIYRILLSQVGVFYLGIASAMTILTIFPFIPSINGIMPYLSYFFKYSVVLPPAISPLLLFIQLRDIRIAFFNWVKKITSASTNAIEE
ncbi:hypothetical protein PRIPAC_73516, partial [Pristionchus pacificus]|uniref:G protein-coupled receptor n=1 Tax=Pristionchus pacificus TaxID=54126 RepID=A0A2A6D075_PRIPA